MLKIYGAPHSRTFRVIWLANEINLPYQHVPVTHDVSDAQCEQPWFLALNPNRRIPVIDDDGFVMWESAAINLYLAEKYKGPLYPNGTPSFIFGYSIVSTAECTLTNANFWLLNGQRRTQQRYSDQQKTRRKKVAVSAVVTGDKPPSLRPRGFAGSPVIAERQ